MLCEMLSPIATEAIYSATYVDNYIDSVENLPDDVQRHLSRIRDIDVQYRGLLRDVDHYYDLWKAQHNTTETSMTKRSRAIARMQQGLIQAQELGDEKMAIVNQLQELIDLKTRQLDIDQKNLDIKEDYHQRLEQDEQCGAGIGGPSPMKQSRTLSPARAEAGSINGGGGGGSSVGGGSTPNSERSSNGLLNGGASANIVVGGGIGGNAGGGAGNSANTSNLSNVNEVQQRSSANKRSRRRNDTATTASNIELGGNESNSANEGGGSNGGNALQKSASNSSTHKKAHVAQGQGGSSVQPGASISNSSGSAGGTAGNGATTSNSVNNTSKKKKRKARGGQSTSQANAREETPPPDPIDPDEPTYCVCNQISFGEMILCDNDLCPIEWFHFSCVSLVLKPKGKWFCPNCRGDRPNVMKPKAQFLKELERYNKEKEEKT